MKSQRRSDDRSEEAMKSGRGLGQRDARIALTEHVVARAHARKSCGGEAGVLSRPREPATSRRRPSNESEEVTLIVDGGEGASALAMV
jgi:hypothetical protein